MGPPRKGNPYVRRVLCPGSIAQEGLPSDWLFRRVRSPRGEQKAILAVAHQLPVIMFYVVRDGSLYKKLGKKAYYDRRNEAKATRQLVEGLQKLGDYATLQPMPGEILATPAIVPPAAENFS